MRLCLATCSLQGKPGDIAPKLRSDLLTIVKMNWALWVPAQFINFRFVPVNLQVRRSGRGDACELMLYGFPDRLAPAQALASLVRVATSKAPVALLHDGARR